MKFDLTIIGNGMIGSLAIFEIAKKFKNKKIAFISPSQRIGSASKAAGAMLNVIAEVDYGLIRDDYQERKIELGIKAQKSWKEFLDQNRIFKKIETANHTIVYLSRHATNLEKKCFEKILFFAKKYKRYLKKNSNLKFLKGNNFIADTIFIKNEGAIDTNEFFKIFDKEIIKKKNVHIFNDNCNKILKSKKVYNIYLSSGKKISSDKIILTIGANTKKVLGKIGSNIQDIFYGVGTALSIESKLDIKNLPKKTVIRTPNRGSTCGVHYVPRLNKKYYIGAGSFISKEPIFTPRAATVEYLLSTSKSEFLKSFGKDKVKIDIGFRPMSFDGKPLIGTLNKHKNIFIVSGTKRDGLTYSTEIIKFMIEWLKNEENKSQYNPFFGWEPERKPISYVDRKFAISAYIENKLAGLLEHNETIKSKKILIKELSIEAKKMHSKITKKYKLNKNFGVHPEVLNVI